MIPHWPTDMEWRDEGVIISVRAHGETSAIIEVFTQNYGRHAGIVRGGASRRMGPILQVGAQVEVQWQARLEEHLGTYKVEPLRSRSSLLGDRLALAALGSVAALTGFSLPERMAFPHFYDQTIHLLDLIEAKKSWLASYALWELSMLEELGYGLDFSGCAATDTTENLIYVSPKSGRSVSAVGGKDWADRLLPLPQFFLGEQAEIADIDYINALQTTGFFLENKLAPALGNRRIPDARGRFVDRVSKTFRGSP